MWSYNRNLLILGQIKDINRSAVKSTFTFTYTKFLFFFFLISIWSQATQFINCKSSFATLMSGNTILCKQFHGINGTLDGAGWQIWAYEQQPSIHKSNTVHSCFHPMQLSHFFCSLNFSVMPCKWLGPGPAGRGLHPYTVDTSPTLQLFVLLFCLHQDPSPVPCIQNHLWAAGQGEEHSADLLWERLGWLLSKVLQFQLPVETKVETRNSFLAPHLIFGLWSERQVLCC